MKNCNKNQNLIKKKYEYYGLNHFFDNSLKADLEIDDKQKDIKYFENNLNIFLWYKNIFITLFSAISNLELSIKGFLIDYLHNKQIKDTDSFYKISVNNESFFQNMFNWNKMKTECKKTDKKRYWIQKNYYKNFEYFIRNYSGTYSSKYLKFGYKYFGEDKCKSDADLIGPFSFIKYATIDGVVNFLSILDTKIQEYIQKKIFNTDKKIYFQILLKSIANIRNKLFHFKQVLNKKFLKIEKDELSKEEIKNTLELIYKFCNNDNKSIFNKNKINEIKFYDIVSFLIFYFDDELIEIEDKTSRMVIFNKKMLEIDKDTAFLISNISNTKIRKNFIKIIGFYKN